MGANTVQGNDKQSMSAPVLRSVVESGTTYIPPEDATVILGADATITIGGEAINLLQGSSFIMIEGISYEFTATTQLGIS